MSQNIYALLVAINNYKSDEIPPLKGCINDIDAIEDFLLTQVGSNANINIKKLKDGEATRQAIINGFEEHLCQANSDNIAFFYFSGHGSQEPVPPQWRDIEPNGLIETLVSGIVELKIVGI
ncbi:MAG: caspase family protein [Xenococcaceae cyanobacterium MO_207.B15]|nr:caspase family protein [Xenococcaceae cyanobacterium MO_207.B15]